MSVMAIGSLVSIGVSVVIRVSMVIRLFVAIRVFVLIRWRLVTIGALVSIGAVMARRWLVSVTARFNGGFGKRDEKEKESEDSHCWNIPAHTDSVNFCF